MYFKDMLRHRNAWLGIASLWIMLNHLPYSLDVIRHLKIIGYGGVDICFFASGIGCYYSLTSDSDVGNFMKRRLKRLMPTYFIFITSWLIAQYFLDNYNLQMALGNLLALQHFSGHSNSFNWYVGAALFFYLLAPYLKTIVDRASPVCKYLFPLFLFICSVPFWQADTHIIVVSRLPIFYIGMLFAHICQQHRRISAHHVTFAIASFLAGILSLAVFFAWFSQYLWSHGLYWYPFILITPPLCMAISYFLIITEKQKFMKPIVSFLSLCGDYSFEIYLMHAFIFSVIPIFIAKFDLSIVSHFVWAAGMIFLVIGCYLLRHMASLFHRLCQRILRIQAKTAE